MRDRGMRLAEGSIPAADRNRQGCCVRVRLSVGRGCTTFTAGTLVGALLLCAPVEAQETAAKISARIERTFDLVLGNSADLAIPLTRRALARRLSADEQKAQVQPLAYGALDEPNATSSIDSPGASGDAATSADPPAVNSSDQIIEQGSAEDPEDPDIARLPRPRPVQDGEAQDVASADAAPANATPEDAMGGPLDLVAGAADPAADPNATADADQPLLAATAPTEDPAALASEAPATPENPIAELVASGECLSPSDVTDKDGDFTRNAEALSGNAFCIAEEKFKERRRNWRIQTIKTSRPGPLFVVMHDDEDMSFDNAVAALKTYGGTLVAMETGGKRNQDGIDPNRNFSADGIGCKKLGKDATPRFTGFFKDLIDASQPIIALHNNTGKRISTGGVGHVSMTDPPKEMEKHKSNDPDGPLADERALVLLTSPLPVSTTSEARAEDLSSKGVNALIERVAENKGDCSLSNYTLLSGHPDYMNVTVDRDEADKQRKIIDVIMSERSATVATQ
jgi:hypothetical protein